MKQIHIALLMAAAMITIALLAVFEYVPEEVAQYSPFLLLAFFAFGWLRSDRGCCTLGQEGR